LFSAGSHEKLGRLGDADGPPLHLISPAVAQKQIGVPKRDGCVQGVLSELQLDHLRAVAARSVRASGGGGDALLPDALKLFLCTSD
jgi:hypothetical protein